MFVSGKEMYSMKNIQKGNIEAPETSECIK